MNDKKEKQPQPTHLSVVSTFRQFNEFAAARADMFKGLRFPLEKVQQIARIAFMRNQDLLQCSLVSIFDCAVKAAQTGLDISGVTSEAFCIPYDDKKRGIKHAQFIIGYQGAKKLAMRNPAIKQIYDYTVYKGEKFSMSLGTMPSIIHEVDDTIEHTRENIRGFYAIAVMQGEMVQVEYISYQDMERIRMAAPSANSPAWSKWYDEMGRGKVIKRLCKHLPHAEDTLQDFGVEDEPTAGLELGDIAVPGIEDERSQAEKIIDKVKEKLGGEVIQPAPEKQNTEATQNGKAAEGKLL